VADFAEFLGASYQRPLSQTQIQVERTSNWRLELLPGGKGKSQFALFRQPGLLTFCTTALNSRVRGLYSLNGHLYAVVGSHYIEILADGTFIDYSVLSGVYLTDDGRKAWFAGNPTQQMLVSGGNGYISESGGVHLIASADFPQGNAASCAYLDGYFIVTMNGSQMFQISALNDGNTWDASDISSAESRPDFIVAPIALREEVWFFGTQTIQPYYNSGDAFFPLAPNQAAVTSTGLMAAASLCRIGNTLFWLKLDENGHGTFCRNDGYVEVEISNHAIESVWNTYQNLDQAYAWGYQENGHSCVRISFPNIDGLGGSMTWEYDLSTNQWTETPYWNQVQARDEAHRGYCSAVCFDKILVGDRENGIIYEMNSRYLDDNGALIRRIRRTPHLYSQNKNIEYNRIEFAGNKGIGLNVAADQPYYNPTAVLRYSNDGGVNFGNERHIKFGRMGARSTRAFKAGLGSSRDRVFELECTDPVDWAFSATRLDFKVLAN